MAEHHFRLIQDHNLTTDYICEMSEAQKIACRLAGENKCGVIMQGFSTKLNKWIDCGEYYNDGTYYDVYGIMRKVKGYGNIKKTCNACKHNSGIIKSGICGETLLWCSLMEKYYEAFDERKCSDFEQNIKKPDDRML